MLLGIIANDEKYWEFKMKQDIAWLRWKTCTSIKWLSLSWNQSAHRAKKSWSALTCGHDSSGSGLAAHLATVACILPLCLDCWHCVSAALQVWCSVKKCVISFLSPTKVPHKGLTYPLMLDLQIANKQANIMNLDYRTELLEKKKLKIIMKTCWLWNWEIVNSYIGLSCQTELSETGFWLM